ncbi:5-methylcytosine-specific restriction endonuclease McrA [Paenibacillus sp. 1182]|uniref:HNH endonuclease n=1 Tax=Paenibacillus sp. 1182 TaxID=2806565 RepID=UPI001B7B7877|nr:HNH endonuclease [Paenibacillus sp. 1182]MBP1309214.1 5-methylcytosine-specific restriction endonuclease McrA [Paenibacillus sp. 1182]
MEYQFRDMELDPTFQDIEVGSIHYSFSNISVMPYDKAIKYIQEKSAIAVTGKKILLLYTDKLLKSFVLERENSVCYYCGDHGLDVIRLIPKSAGGIKSPKNMICVCKECKLADVTERLRRMDKNPFRDKGLHSWLYKKCPLCLRLNSRRNFTQSICKMCWKSQLLKKDELSIKKIPFVERLNVQNVIRSMTFIKKNHVLVDDLSLLDPDHYAFQIYHGNKSEKQKWAWKIVPFEDAKLLVEEGFCKIIPYYKNIIVNVISQNYQTFRKHILRRDKFTCYYCGKPGDTIDHKIPLSKGGLTSPKNCVVACSTCNVEKGDTHHDPETL